MPSTVIERAERFLTREDKNFEAVVRKLHDERAALELARAAAEQREREAGEARERLEVEIENAKNREKRMLGDEARELMDRLRRAREDLRDAQARLRAKKIEPDALREAERSIERVSGEVAIGGALERLVASPAEGPSEPVCASELKRGARVWVPRLRAEAEVVDVHGEQVRVAAGPLKLSIAASELRAVAPPEAVPSRPVSRATATRQSTQPDAVALQTRDNTCDLRGLRVEDAVSMAMTFLDRAVGERHGAVFLLHGHGTGALRQAIREELGRSPYVAKFRAGDSDQGGDGVTVVWLA
jgi:DNA mismatch repair protein MutS2